MYICIYIYIHIYTCARGLADSSATARWSSARSSVSDPLLSWPCWGDVIEKRGDGSDQAGEMAPPSMEEMAPRDPLVSCATPARNRDFMYTYRTCPVQSLGRARDNPGRPSYCGTITSRATRSAPRGNERPNSQTGTQPTPRWFNLKMEQLKRF